MDGHLLLPEMNDLHVPGLQLRSDMRSFHKLWAGIVRSDSVLLSKSHGFAVFFSK